MQAITDGVHTGKSTIRYLPMIDLPPTDLSSIYSTLMFICKECTRHKCTPVITFDQPLWFKARTIIEHERKDSVLKSIVLALGGFHTMMSFLGSIGHTMVNSGLREVLETSFSENAVTYMLTGKSVSRAVRGNLLVEATLSKLLIQKTFGNVCEETNVYLQLAEELFVQVLRKHVPVSTLDDHHIVETISVAIQETIVHLKNFPTPTLWFQYMDMVDILRDFIRSQRTGSWLSHINCLQRMIPFFAATGHNNYAKCVQLYV